MVNILTMRALQLDVVALQRSVLGLTYTCCSGSDGNAGEWSLGAFGLLVNERASTCAHMPAYDAFCSLS